MKILLKVWMRMNFKEELRIRTSMLAVIRTLIILLVTGRMVVIMT